VATFTITVQGDNVVEPDETIEFTLMNPTAPEGQNLMIHVATAF
jgi:hypothetical protein